MYIGLSICWAFYMCQSIYSSSQHKEGEAIPTSHFTDCVFLGTERLGNFKCSQVVPLGFRPRLAQESVLLTVGPLGVVFSLASRGLFSGEDRTCSDACKVVMIRVIAGDCSGARVPLCRGCSGTTGEEGQGRLPRTGVWVLQDESWRVGKNRASQVKVVCS